MNVERQGRVATIELNRKPVNSFSLEFLEEINTNLEMLENDKECHGLIITSVCLVIFKYAMNGISSYCIIADSLIYVPMHPAEFE